MVQIRYKYIIIFDNSIYQDGILDYHDSNACIRRKAGKRRPNITFS